MSCNVCPSLVQARVVVLVQAPRPFDKNNDPFVLGSKDGRDSEMPSVPLAEQV